MEHENLNTEETANSDLCAVSGSLHQMRAINTYNEMKKQLAKLKQKISFREYIGFEMAMQIFYKRYEKWLSNDF